MELPDEATLAAAVRPSRPRPQTLSSLLPHADEAAAWHADQIQGAPVYRALCRAHGHLGTYSEVRRHLQTLPLSRHRATTPLEYEAGELAQVDFGRGPEIIKVHTGEVIGTWIRCMVLA